MTFDGFLVFSQRSFKPFNKKFFFTDVCTKSVKTTFLDLVILFSIWYNVWVYGIQKVRNSLNQLLPFLYLLTQIMPKILTKLSRYAIIMVICKFVWKRRMIFWHHTKINLLNFFAKILLQKYINVFDLVRWKKS